MNGDDKCHPSLAHERNCYVKTHIHTNYDPMGPKKDITTLWCVIQVKMCCLPSIRKTNCHGPKTNYSTFSITRHGTDTNHGYQPLIRASCKNLTYTKCLFTNLKGGCFALLTTYFHRNYGMTFLWTSAVYHPKGFLGAQSRHSKHTCVIIGSRGLC